MTIPGLEKPAPRRTAKDMLDLLDKHYAPPPSKPAGGRLISEIQAPHGLRRADALYLPITTGGRGTIIGHEIKVNRADVMAEVADPHKADAWMRYCNRWWLVISSASIIEGIPIPPEWGIMLPPSRNRFMTIVRDAPKLEPDRSILAEAWGTIFARVGYADVAAEADRAHWHKEADRLGEKVREQSREITRLSQVLGDEGQSAYRSNRLTVTNVLTEIDRLAEYGDDTPKAFRGLAWQLDAETVARGILAEVAGRDRRDIADDIVSAIQRANTVAERLKAVLDEISTPPGAAA
ncbi:hypothetical protein GCM10009775_04460 [Microbacterium aoyamense]|uniref:Uncharacterized protein n=1 Tax=Microbacterium aoyamense TaxID=344166 RepID=A0ABP5APB7_9MICO|nr:hypothetical protein [Microbacterium aoyamense]